MAKKVERKEEFKLYCYVNEDDNSVSPPEELLPMLQQIDHYASEGLLSDVNQGKFEAISEIMATPVCTMQDRFKFMLEDIITETTGELEDEAEEDDDEAAEKAIEQSTTKEVNMQQRDLTDEEMEEILDEEERPLPRCVNPPSEHFLNRWYSQGATIIISGWHDMNYMEKITAYRKWCIEHPENPDKETNYTVE